MERIRLKYTITLPVIPRSAVTLALIDRGSIASRRHPYQGLGFSRPVSLGREYSPGPPGLLRSGEVDRCYSAEVSLLLRSISAEIWFL